MNSESGDAAREAHSEFEQWKQKYAPNDSGKDYDFRGAFDAGVLPDANGHWPDLFKRPNHPTFSEESVFAIGLNASEAGRWHNSLFLPPTAPAPFSAFASGERLGNREGQMTTEQYDAFRAGMLRAAEMARNEFKRAPEAAKGEDCVWMGGYESACDHLSIVIAQAAVIDSVPIGERRPDWKYHISLLLPEETPDETVKGIYCVVEQLLREVAPAPARHYFCSCGGALTAEEYLEHYFEKGHDRGIGGKTAPAGVEAVARQAALRIQTWLREEGEFGRDVIQELTDIIVAEFTHCATPAPAESGEDLDDMEFTLNWNRLQGGNYRALHERWQPIFDLVKQLRDQVRQGTPAPRG